MPFEGLFDLSKAFDTLDHYILVHKLDHYGISGVIKHLFESNITNRQRLILELVIFCLIYIIIYLFIYTIISSDHNRNNIKMNKYEHCCFQSV